MCVSVFSSHTISIFSDDIVGLSDSAKRWNLVKLPSNLQTLLWFKSIHNLLVRHCLFDITFRLVHFGIWPNIARSQKWNLHRRQCTPFRRFTAPFSANPPAFYALSDPVLKLFNIHKQPKIHISVKKNFLVRRNVQPYDPERLSILFFPPHEKFHLSLSNYNSGFFHCL